MPSQTFNASGTFNIPSGVTQVAVKAWGEGGNGGTSARGSRSGAGGGGGAFAGEPTLVVTSGGSLTVVVGTGGTGTATSVTGGIVTVLMSWLSQKARSKLLTNSSNSRRCSSGI